MSSMIMNSILYKYSYEHAMNMMDIHSIQASKYVIIVFSKESITLGLFKNRGSKQNKTKNTLLKIIDKNNNTYYRFCHVILVLKHYWANM